MNLAAKLLLLAFSLTIYAGLFFVFEPTQAQSVLLGVVSGLAAIGILDLLA